jgi:hypothetical protein
VLVAKKLGHRTRTLTPVLEGDHAVTMKLDPASADETRGQLAAAIGAGVDPTEVEIPRATASAFGVDLLVLVWTRNWQVHAAAYQAGSTKMTHVALDGQQATPRAVAAALHDWRAAAGTDADARAGRVSISMSRELIFLSLGVAVVVAGIALAFRVRRSRQLRQDIAYR